MIVLAPIALGALAEVDEIPDRSSDLLELECKEPEDN